MKKAVSEKTARISVQAIDICDNWTIPGTMKLELTDHAAGQHRALTERTKMKPTLGLLDIETRELFKTCVHEAAHTVAARKNGFPVKWVSVDADFIRNDPIAIEFDCNAGNPVCMAISSPILKPIIAQGRLITKAEKEIVINYGIQVLAGPYAELDYDPETYDRQTADEDVEQISALLATVVRSMPERKRLRNVIQRGTKKFVATHWHTIQYVAAQLHARRTICEHEIDALISRAPAPVGEARP